MLSSILKVVTTIGVVCVVDVIALRQQTACNVAVECSINTILEKRSVPGDHWMNVDGIKGWMNDRTPPKATVDLKRLVMRLTSDDTVVEIDLESVLMAVFPSA